MIQTIVALYVTLMPVILAGIANMMFCKSSLFEAYNRPMDQGQLWSDGRRLLGANKTWKGFWGMVFWGMVAQLAWGGLLHFWPDIEALHLVYALYGNHVALNALLGASLGLAYVVFELPNSFLKRRFAIEPGKTAQNGWKWPFVLLDQIDSLIGCLLVLGCYRPLTAEQVMGTLMIGTVTHLGVNRLLYWAKFRHNKM